MDKFYHFTSSKNIGNIAKEGLVQNSGTRCQSIGDGSSGVFLSKGIDQSIVMYALMRSFYSKFYGSEGDKKLKECNDRIKKLEDDIKRGGNIVYDRLEIINQKSIIDSVKLIRSFKSFYEYMDGSCCLLRVDGITANDIEVPSNYCYHGEISPKNIELVYLINKYNGSFIYDLEPILAYLMNYYNPYAIAGENVEDIISFYNDMYFANQPYYYNPKVYQLSKMHISAPEQSNRNIKVL